MATWVIAGAALLVAVMTVLPFCRHGHWLVRLGDFPRRQLALLALAVPAMAWWLLPPGGWLVPVIAAVCGGCALIQMWWIWPYTPLHRREVRQASSPPAARRLRILAANVLTPNRNADALIACIRREAPSIVVTLETDRWWEARLDTLGADYPHVVRCPQDNLYGMHVYSRLPLEDTKLQYLVEDAVPSVHTAVRLPSGDAIELHCLHPAPPSPTENETSRERDAELILVGRSIAGRDEPIVVTGDLNDVAWSPTTRLFRRISGLLDPRIGRGTFATFHARYPFLRWPLDHVFHSDHFTLVEMRRLEAFGSDHFPLLFELALEPRQRSYQAAPEGYAGDQKAADELLAEADTDTTAGDVHRPRARVPAAQ